MKRLLLITLASVSLLLVPLAAPALMYHEQAHINQIIDATGAGEGRALVDPRGIAVDNAGNVYVAGAESDNAFKITPEGEITQVIDSTGDGAYALDSPADIAVDGLGNVYVSGTRSDNVFKITPSGSITRIIGPSGDGEGNLLDRPDAIAVDGLGNVYVAGYESENAFKITPGGEITQIIDSAGDGTNDLRHPTDIAADASGNAYVAGNAGGYILPDDTVVKSEGIVFKIAPDGTIATIIDFWRVIGFGEIARNWTRFIAVDNDGNLYATGGGDYGPNEGKVFRFTPGVGTGMILDTDGDGWKEFDGPSDIAVDPTGKAYVAGGGSRNIFKLTGGKFEIVDTRWAVASGPRKIAADNAGNVYFTGIDGAFKFSGFCGDGKLHPSEECDDGDIFQEPYNGCARCKVEMCFSCAGEPSSCTCNVGSPCPASICQGLAECQKTGTWGDPPPYCRCVIL